MNVNSRTGTSSSYDNMLRNISARQRNLTQAQEQLASGKRVLRGSDDPSSAAQAERALQRIERINSDMRALKMQTSNISMAETTLGDATSVLQRVRELVLAAGNGSLDVKQRTGIADEIRSLRNTLLGYANRQDGNGVALFGGLGSSEAPFVETASGVVYTGLQGQVAADAVSLPYALDGFRTWMLSPLRDGVYNASFSVNQGGMRSSATSVTNLSQLQDTSYTIDFSPPGYTVTDGQGNSVTTGTYTAGQPITFNGLSLTVTGQPVAGDQLKLTPTNSIFQALDTAVAAFSAPATTNDYGQVIGQVLSAIDTGMNLMQASRGQAGELLNLSDRIESSQTARADQLEKDRSAAEDLDMAEGITRLQSQQTAY